MGAVDPVGPGRQAIMAFVTTRKGTGCRVRSTADLSEGTVASTNG